jgi:hypothetical protein
MMYARGERRSPGSRKFHGEGGGGKLNGDIESLPKEMDNSMQTSTAKSLNPEL